MYAGEGRHGPDTGAHMHELSVMTSLMELAEKEAAKAHAKRVKRLVVRVGALSGVAPEFLESAFQYMQVGTIAESATLELVPEPAKGHCPACGHDYEMHQLVLECPACAEVGVEVEGGQELYLETMEIEVDDGQDPSG